MVYGGHYAINCKQACSLVNYFYFSIHVKTYDFRSLGHHRPARLKCRRVKLLVNRNLQLKKKTTDAMKRRLSKNHAKKMLHKFITSSKHKRFHL